MISSLNVSILFFQATQLIRQRLVLDGSCFRSFNLTGYFEKLLFQSS